jgi:hypothetical protein
VFGLFAEHSAQAFGAAYNVGNLLWLQANQVCLVQPLIPHEDGEYSEQVRISELVNSIHGLAAFGEVCFDSPEVRRNCLMASIDVLPPCQMATPQRRPS